MRVLIKKLDGKKQEHNLEKTDSVFKVRQNLAERAGIKSDQIRLIFKGQPMTDDKTLDDYKVTSGDIIHLILNMRGGGYV